jgi:hypothetical protein
MECDNLTSVTISEKNKHFSNAFPETAKIDYHLTPTTQTADGFGIIEENGTITVYSYPVNTKNIIIPETINGLPVMALDVFPIYSDEDWEQYLENVKDIETVIIPDTVLVIRPGAFQAFVNFKTITIPPGVRLIDNAAFSSCISA